MEAAAGRERAGFGRSGIGRESGEACEGLVDRQNPGDGVEREQDADGGDETSKGERVEVLELSTASSLHSFTFWSLGSPNSATPSEGRYYVGIRGYGKSSFHLRRGLLSSPFLTPPCGIFSAPIDPGIPLPL